MTSQTGSILRQSETKPTVSYRLDGQHVMITGAGGGIGAALCAVFSQAGALLTAADVDPSALAKITAARKLVFDVTDASTTTQKIAELIAQVGAPDILINNAGYTRSELLKQVDLPAWDKELAINLTGCFNVTSPILEAMADRGSGSIVFISSVNALGYYGNPAYSVAKAGLLAYCGAIAVEHGQHGIRSNVVCPGSVRTPAWDHRVKSNPGILNAVVAHYPLGRLVSPEEVAHAALFLASPAAGGITGAVVPVDAGLSAGNLRFVRDVFEGGKQQ